MNPDEADRTGEGQPTGAEREQARINTKETTTRGTARAAIKVVVAGASGTGKTSLVRRLAGQAFAGAPGPTVGMDVFIVPVAVPGGGGSVPVALHDTSGLPRFASLHERFMKDAGAAIVVVAQDDPTSVHGVPGEPDSTRVPLAHWVKRLDAANPGRHVPSILVVNKGDLVDAGVLDDATVAGLRAEHGFSAAFRCSARTGANVHEAVQFIVGEAVREAQGGR